MAAGGSRRQAQGSVCGTAARCRRHAARGFGGEPGACYAPLACSPCVLPLRALTWREILGADGILAESRLGVERSLARLECRVHLLHVLLVGAVWRAALLIEIGEDPALSGIDQLDLGGRG